MKETMVVCAGCGKKLSVTCGEGHTGIVKCDCGVTTTVKGNPGAVLDEINRLLEKVPALIQQLRDSKRKGFETGVDEAIHEAARQATISLLKEDPRLRDDLKELVRIILEEWFRGGKTLHDRDQT